MPTTRSEPIAIVRILLLNFMHRGRCALHEGSSIPLARYSLTTASAPHDDAEYDDEDAGEEEKNIVPAVRKSQERQNGDECAGEHDERVERHGESIALCAWLNNDNEFAADGFLLFEIRGEFCRRARHYFFVDLGELTADGDLFDADGGKFFQ